MKFGQALQTMDMPRKKYLMLLVLTITMCGIALPALMWFTIGPLLDQLTLIAMFAMFYFLVAVIIIWPWVSASSRRIKIDRSMPLYVTELAALSTSDMPFDKVFFIMAQKREYGPLAKDSMRIFRLMKYYNVSVAEACRFIASHTPSRMENDFFSRLGHAVDIGEKLDRFMKNEHDVMMDEYVLKCEGSLKDVEFVKEIFSGAITALIFICVFVSIIPLLGSQTADTLIYGIVIGFMIMEGAFVYLILSKVPKDDIWYPLRQKYRAGLLNERDRMMIIAVVIAVLGMVGLYYLLSPLDIPLMLFAATICLPVLIPGIMIMREEKKIEKRDEIFGAFIRSLGRSCSVSGQTMPGAVKNLAIHKFGPLTSAVQNLSKRLAMHISPTDSWGHFSAETSSNMIKKFSGMYTQCVLSGSKPEETSLFISNNLFKILAIRKKRISISSSFVGVLYGIMVALAFTMWITVGITEYMASVVSNLAADTTSIATGGFLTNIFNASYNIDLLTNMVVGVILIHALFSSIMLPLVKGGHLATAGIHFVVMVWVGAAAGYVVQLMTKSLFV